MMLKLIGLSLIVLCGVGVGWLSAMRLQQERTAIERLCQFLREISVQIEFRASTVQELLEQISAEPAYARFCFLQSVASALNTGTPLCQAWHDGIQADAAVPDPATEILLPLGYELGASDLSGQAETLAQYQHRLEDCLQTVSAHSLRRQRLYLSMGALGGMMAAILLC